MDSLKSKLESLGYITRYIGEELAVGIVHQQYDDYRTIHFPMGIMNIPEGYQVRFVLVNNRESEIFKNESKVIEFVKGELPL